MEENFIPWEQIEPLLADCETGGELGEKIRARLGLTKGLYSLHTAEGTGLLSFREALRSGLRVYRRGTAESRKGWDARSESVR